MRRHDLRFGFAAARRPCPGRFRTSGLPTSGGRRPCARGGYYVLTFPARKHLCLLACVMGNRWPRKATPVRLIHWVFIGSAVTVLLIMSCTRFYPREYREGILFLVFSGYAGFCILSKAQDCSGNHQFAMGLGECGFKRCLAPGRLEICRNDWVCCWAVLHRSLVLQTISIPIVQKPAHRV